MLFARPYAAVLVSLLISVPLGAQQASPPPISATTLLQRSLAAQIGNTQISDVTLTGTARRIAGSDDETGTVTLKALVSGEVREDFSFPSGQWNEIRANSENGPVGQSRGPDGALHATAYHNLQVESPWFFPALLLRKLSSSQGLLLASDTEPRDELTVEHLILSKQFSGPHLPENAAKLMQHASQVEVFLDPATLLPTAISFNTHPDRDASRDIPVEIRFSDYRLVNGVRVPFRIQKFINNGLVLDLQMESVAFNTGLSASSFNLQ